MIAMSSTTPARKSCRTKALAMKVAQTMSVGTPPRPTAMPHRPPKASSAAMAATRRARSDSVKSSRQSPSSTSRSKEARRLGGGNGRGDGGYERVLRGGGARRALREARDAHQHPVGNAAREPAFDLHAQALEAAAHHPIAHGEPVGP